MPVTAKLSRRFYEAFGDDIANELVEWFNQVDAANRSDLKDLAHTIAAGLDAKHDQFRAEVRQELAEIRAEFRTELHREVGALRSELIKWMFVFWTGSVVTTTVLVLAVVSALRR